MALSNDLITTARQLAHVHQRRPRQVDLRRSISTSYYALFHGLAELAAGRLVGSTSAAQKSPAWSRVYRDLNHLTVKKACSRPELQGCSQELARFLMAFPTVQELRHQADYDPIIRFNQGEALSADDAAECALADRLSRRLDRPVESISASAKLRPVAVRGSKAKPPTSNAEA